MNDDSRVAGLDEKLCRQLSVLVNRYEGIQIRNETGIERVLHRELDTRMDGVHVVEEGSQLLMRMSPHPDSVIYVPCIQVRFKCRVSEGRLF